MLLEVGPWKARQKEANSHKEQSAGLFLLLLCPKLFVSNLPTMARSILGQWLDFSNNWFPHLETENIPKSQA